MEKVKRYESIFKEVKKDLKEYSEKDVFQIKIESFMNVGTIVLYKNNKEIARSQGSEHIAHLEPIFDKIMKNLVKQIMSL
jgi:hypothetical protein